MDKGFSRRRALGSYSLLALNERGNAVNRVEVFHAGFMRFNLNAEALFDERDEAQSGDGVKNAAGAQWRIVVQVRGFLAGEKLREDELPNLFFHVVCRHVIRFPNLYS